MSIWPFPQFKPESIAASLLTLLSQANTVAAANSIANFTPFVTFTRAPGVPTNVPSAQQPYLGLIGLGGRQLENQAQGAEKWILEYAALIYIRAVPTPATIPEQVLNAAWLAVVATMRAGSVQPGASGGPAAILGERQTLGNTVDNAWIDGECLMNTGIIDQQLRLLIPIKVSVGL